MVHYVFGLRGLAHFVGLLWLGPLVGLVNNSHTHTRTEPENTHTLFCVEVNPVLI